MEMHDKRVTNPPMSSDKSATSAPAIEERQSVQEAPQDCPKAADAGSIPQAGSNLRMTQARNLYDRIHDRFSAIGGINLDLPPREPVREPPRFD